MMCSVAQPRERRFQLQRFVDGFANEPLDDLLAPGSERPPPEAAAKSFHAGKTDAADLDGVAIEHGEARVHEDFPHVVLLIRFVVVIAEHGHHWNLQDTRELAHQCSSFVDKTVVGEVAAQREDVGRLADLGQERLKRPRRHGPAIVKISQCSDTDDIFCHSPG